MVLFGTGPGMRVGEVLKAGAMTNFPRSILCCRAAGRPPVVWMATALAILCAVVTGSSSAQADDALKFAKLIKIQPSGGLAAAAGAAGSLATKEDSNFFDLRLSNVSVGGASGATELRTRVNRASLGLESSIVYDLVKGEPVRKMVRKTDKSELDGKDTDVFEFTEFSDKNVTKTEPFIEFKVVDFISVMLVAADAINRNDLNPQDLSMLRDRSVRRVTMTFAGQKAVGKQKGTLVRVAPPDNPSGGISYVIGRSPDGSYYPLLISAQTDQGAIDLEGTAQ